MNLRNYLTLFAALAFGVLLATGQARGQGSVLVVEWGDELGNPIKNALRDAIANDTERPADRVYKLRRGGFYWNEDRIQYDGFHLRLIGETVDEAGEDAFVCGSNFDEDCGPAIIQRVRRADQSIDGVMISNSGDGSHLTLENIWLMGQDSDGVKTAYEQLSLNTKNARFTFNHVIFDRNDWHFLGPNSENCDMIVTNSLFRNLHGPSQQWEGLGVRFEVGADSVIFENNTFLNIGFTPFQSEAAPMNYFVANHNTFVNVGRTFQAGAMWKEAYIANNIFINPFWHGEQPSEYSDPDRVDPYTGFFGIGALPARFGTDFDRRIVVVNNSYWRDPVFETYDPNVRTQPFINDTTAGWFARYDNMVFADNYIGANPTLTTYPDVTDLMIQNIIQLRAGNSNSPTYRWDLGRDEECFVCNIWPLPENFTYTNPELLLGGTDGLPLGDLNWYPDAKATYLAGRTQLIKDLYDRAGAVVVLDPIALIEAETGTLDGDAEVYVVEGFAAFFMQGSGKIEWKFTVDEAGTYGLNLHTNMRNETQRGQHVRINGVGLRNNNSFGEYYFCTAAIGGCAVPLANNTWETVEIRAANLIAGADALTLQAGVEYTIQLAPSWGWQAFSGVDVVDADGEVVVSLNAPDAYYEGVQATCEAAYCPQFFKSVELNPGGSVAFGVAAPYSGMYTLRVFFAALDGAASGKVWVNGEVVVDGVSFAATDSAGSDLFSAQFPMSAGANTVAISSESGTVLVDYVQLIGFPGSTSTERNQLPKGYALDQNYPNPFNPSTTISYTLADASGVRIDLFDALGRHVRTLMDGDMPAGTHRVIWDGTATSGVQVSSGVYFYRMHTSVGQTVRTMVFMK